MDKQCLQSDFIIMAVLLAWHFTNNYWYKISFICTRFTLRILTVSYSALLDFVMEINFVLGSSGLGCKVYGSRVLWCNIMHDLVVMSIRQKYKKNRNIWEMWSGMTGRNRSFLHVQGNTNIIYFIYSHDLLCTDFIRSQITWHYVHEM